VCLQQPDRADYWLYTSKGNIDTPPSRSGDARWRLPREQAPFFRLDALLKGVGRARVYIFWYGRNSKGGHCERAWIRRLWLGTGYQRLRATFSPPGNAEEFRVCFLLGKEDNKKFASICVKDLQVDIAEQRP